MRDTVQRSIGVVLMINDTPVAGQENAKLVRSMTPIEITNKIDASWRENIGGLKTWSIQCSGTYVNNAESFTALEQAFMSNEEIEVKVILNNHTYMGQALITSFPLSAVFNTQFKYTISLLGAGELRLVEDDRD